MKLFHRRKVMVLVAISIHEARVSSTFFGGLKASRRGKLKKLIIWKILRAVFCKDRLRVCKIEKSDFPKLCQKEGLDELFLKI